MPVLWHRPTYEGLDLNIPAPTEQTTVDKSFGIVSMSEAIVGAVFAVAVQ